VTGAVTGKRLLAIACAAGVALAADARWQPAHADPMPPEDPVKAAKSSAQWRAHLEAEEHERKLFYDRDRLKDHRAVLKLLVAARARYDRARTKAAVLAAQKRQPATDAEIRRLITQIDRWGTNSNLLGDYDAYLKALSDSYPAARSEMLDGHPGAQDTARRQLDQLTRHIKDWMAEAARSKDE
jgi:hypothetical protein